MGSETLLAIPQCAAGVISADFNRDGMLDFAILAPDRELVVLLGSEGGLYRQSYRRRLCADPRDLYAADLDGDGHIDLAVLYSHGRRTSFFYGSGDGTFSSNREALIISSSTWSLTARELEVASLAARGYTCMEIAAQLGNSPRTIETHIEAIRSKLDLKHKRELVALTNPRRTHSPES